MLSRLATAIPLGLISTGTYANSLEITSLSQTQGEKAESTYVGEPIVASKKTGARFFTLTSKEKKTITIG